MTNDVLYWLIVYSSLGYVKLQEYYTRVMEKNYID